MSYLAEMDTRHYDWLATGDTEKLAIKAMMSGWRKWKRINRDAGIRWYSDEDVRDMISTTKLPTFRSATGKHLKPACWLDHSLLWMQGASEKDIQKFNDS